MNNLKVQTLVNCYAALDIIMCYVNITFYIFAARGARLL